MMGPAKVPREPRSGSIPQPRVAPTGATLGQAPANRRTLKALHNGAGQVLGFCRPHQQKQGNHSPIPCGAPGSLQMARGIGYAVSRGVLAAPSVRPAGTGGFWRVYPITKPRRQDGLAGGAFSYTLQAVFLTYSPRFSADSGVTAGCPLPRLSL